MSKLDIASFFNSAKAVLTKHSPEILTGLGIAGMITTTVLAVRATPKALELIEESKREKKVEKLNAIDTVKATWKCYVPAVITGTVSTACLIGATSISTGRNAALMTAYKLSENALAEYREQVVDTIGEKKEKTIRDKVNQERLDKNPVSANEIVLTGLGNTLCYDYQSARYFHSDIHILKRAVNVLNRQLVTSPFSYVSLNEFYEEIGLEPNQLGSQMGWNVNDGEIELELSASLTDKQEPCMVVDFNKDPKYNFANVY